MLVLDGSRDDEEGDDEVIHAHTHHHYHHPHEGSEANVTHHADHPVLHEVREHLADPPATWRAYAGQPNEMMAIIEMEYRELVQAKSSGDTKAIKQELVDLAAACVHAAKSM